MALLTQLAQVKAEYDKVADALKEVEETGYGIVVPSIDSLVLEEPEIVRQGGRYGVRLKASAPSIHMIRADIETEVSPIVGSEKQSEEMIHYLLQEFEGDTAKIWQSNIFGKSFHELVGEDLNAKVKRMPEDARHSMSYWRGGARPSPVDRDARRARRLGAPRLTGFRPAGRPPLLPRAKELTP